MIRTALLALVVFAACKKPEEPAPTPTGSAAPPVILATEDIATVARGVIETGPRISGTLEARVRAVVRAEVNGSVVTIGPELGDRVKKGGVLARIEAKALGDSVVSGQSAVASAQAQLDLARREVERTAALVKGGAIAQRELDRAQSAAKSAEAGVAQARAALSGSRSQLGDAVARSPIDGVVAQRSANAGDVVAPGNPLYEIIDPSTMRLSAAVASDDLRVIALGKIVRFTVRGYPGEKFEGKIARIAPAADPATRQIPLIVEIPNTTGKLVAGLYAEGRVAAEEREALIVPMSAVDFTRDQASVLRAKAGGLERVTITIGLRDDRSEVAEVTAGLAAGDVVVQLRAAKNLTPGQQVELGKPVAATDKAKP
ncbi:MAG: efflux RND transporter periplasmic adaptor subunit [Kofleriaceae bacterium]